MRRLLNKRVISRISPPLKNFNHGHRSFPSLTAEFSSSSLRTMVATATAPRLTELNFPITPVPKNPLGEGKYIRNAAALIIGDEILNGKVQDKNTQYFATFCFQQGIDLKRVEVIPDDEAEIIEAARRMVQKYDIVITSGGIGPTHDDITYESLAKAFGQDLEYHEETLHRMTETNKTRAWVSLQNKEQITAQHRMALFPNKSEVIFPCPDIWTPVVRLEGKLCVLPGVPMLFRKMLQELAPLLPLPPPHERPFRYQIFTDSPESSIAPFLTALQERVKNDGIRIGSYPFFGRGVCVSLIGLDKPSILALGGEVIKETGGYIITEKELDEMRQA
ncbi:MoaB/Mog domain-containing protein [Thelephora terrestris]|uniref:MoaB/Mog domain-containing protein n=1 Tax=Thelephora terrestris TaxID=56493 RepID=A0A9P6L929_9AGAM|nr:MoaB/Mog domain-containing protein [Thelephora terrestris]